MKRLITIIFILTITTIFIGCTERDADVVSYNLSKEADMFRVTRRIVFYNGITNDYMLVITGNCSIADDGRKLAVTCKTGVNTYKKHYLGLSDNVTYFAEQIKSNNVSKFRYSVVFKPTVLIPDIELSR